MSSARGRFNERRLEIQQVGAAHASAIVGAVETPDDGDRRAADHFHAGRRLIPRHPGAAESHLAPAPGFPLPADRQVVADAQFPHLPAQRIP